MFVVQGIILSSVIVFVKWVVLFICIQVHKYNGFGELRLCREKCPLSCLE